MRSFALPVLAVAALAALPSAASAGTSCSGSFDPQGNAGGGFYAHIVAGGVSCAKARSVTRKWVTQAEHRSSPVGTMKVGPYTCTASFRMTDPEGTLVVRCVDGPRVVRFTGHP